MIRDPERQCYGKAQYNTKAKAKHHLSVMKKIVGDVMSAYRCPHCHFWHVGHPPSSKRIHKEP